jgi:hypothetical protein
MTPTAEYWQTHPILQNYFANKASFGTWIGFRKELLHQLETGHDITVKIINERRRYLNANEPWKVRRLALKTK